MLAYYQFKTWFYRTRYRFQGWRMSLPWRIKQYFFKWKLDNENDLALVFMNRIAFIKYKQSTIIIWVRASRMKDAPKYLNIETTLTDRSYHEQ